MDTHTQSEPNMIRLGIIKGGSPLRFCTSGIGPNFVTLIGSKWNPEIYQLDNLANAWRTIGTGAADLCIDPSGTLVAGAIGDIDYDLYGFVYEIEKERFLKFFGNKRHYTAAGLGGSRRSSVNPSGTLLAVATSALTHGVVHIIDVNELRLTGTAKICYKLSGGDLFDAKALTWSPDGTILAQCGSWVIRKMGIIEVGNCEAVLLWKFDSTNPASISAKHIGSLNYPFKFDSESTLAQTFSPDSKLLALGSDRKADDKVKVFEVATQKLVCQTPSLKKTTTHLAFSPNGKYLLSSDDRYLRIWEVQHTGDSWSLAHVRSILCPGDTIGFAHASREQKIFVAHKEGKSTVISSMEIPFDMGCVEPVLPPKQAVSQGEAQVDEPVKSLQSVTENVPSQTGSLETVIPVPQDSLPKVTPLPAVSEQKKVGCWVWPSLIIGALLSIAGFCLGTIVLYGKVSGASPEFKDMGTFLTGIFCFALAPMVIGLGLLGIGIYTLRKKVNNSIAGK